MAANRYTSAALFAERVTEDTRQDDEVRVHALDRYADFGYENVAQYQASENEELASEVDLLERLDAWDRQQAQSPKRQ